MTWTRAIGASLTVVLLVATAVHGENATTVVGKGKPATALVRGSVGGRISSGTAFCIEPSGYFVTNNHVVAELVGEKRVTLVLNPGETNQRVVPARVVRNSPATDLAVLKAESQDPFPTLEIGSVDGLIETVPVVAFGYPFGTGLSTDKNEYPAITVSTGHITSLRKVSGELVRIQLDASLNPGNSGGPVLDEKGTVIGVVASGIVGTGVNFAVSANHIHAVVEKPEIEFVPPRLLAGQVRDKQEFQIRVVSFTGPRKFEAELVLNPDRENTRTIALQRQGDVFKGAGVVGEEPVGPSYLLADIQFSKGHVACRIKDQTILLDKQSIALHDVQRIERDGKQWRVVLTQKWEVKGEIPRSPQLQMDLGDEILPLDLAKMTSLTLVPIDPPLRSVAYRVVVKEGGQPVGTVDGAIPVGEDGVATTQSGATGSAPSTSPPLELPTLLLDSVRTVVKLPSPLDDLAVCAGGRYLALRLGKLDKIAIFEPATGKVVQYLDPGPNPLIAGGQDALVVAVPSQGVLQRWNLRTFKKDLSVPMPVQGKAVALAMGASSAGPVLLQWVDERRSVGKRFAFLSLETLKVTQDVDDRTQDLRNWGNIRASANGTVFGVSAQVGTPGLGTIVLEGGIAKVHTSLEYAPYVVPGPDGKTVFVGADGYRLCDLKRVARAPVCGTGTLPAVEPGFFFSTPVTSTFPPKERLAGAVYVADTAAPLVNLPQMPEMEVNGPELPGQDRIPIDKRFIFIPSAKLFITVLPDQEQFVIHKFDIMQALIQSGVDYLFVSSQPVCTATKGELYVYALSVKSKKGGLTYKLDSAPVGMTISDAGKIEWRVPTKIDAEQAGVIVSVRDAAGQSIFHTFAVSIK